MESMTLCAFSCPISVAVSLAYLKSLMGQHLTLIIVDDVAKVIPATVVRLAHAHRVMCEVHIAVVAEVFRHRTCEVFAFSIT